MRKHQHLTDQQLSDKIHLVMDSTERSDNMWATTLLAALLEEHRLRAEQAQ